MPGISTNPSVAPVVCLSMNTFAPFFCNFIPSPPQSSRYQKEVDINRAVS